MKPMNKVLIASTHSDTMKHDTKRHLFLMHHLTCRVGKMSNDVDYIEKLVFRPLETPGQMRATLTRQPTGVRQTNVHLPGQLDYTVRTRRMQKMPFKQKPSIVQSRWHRAPPIGIGSDGGDPDNDEEMDDNQEVRDKHENMYSKEFGGSGPIGRSNWEVV